MCGRYALTTSREALAALMRAVAATEFPPRYNISPGQTVQAVAVENGRRLLTPYRWGLIPSFATADKPSPLVFNARTETASQRPAFRSALQSRRCLVPADAWYEWQAIGRFKQPYLIRRVDRSPMMFAGLWERVPGADRAAGRALAILTVAASDDVSAIHDRMPAVLAPEYWDAWLDVRVDGGSLAMRCLEPAREGAYETSPIGALINQTGNDGPEVQEPAPSRGEAEAGQPRLI
ncbi:SOS response-associated peptidase [Hansschlegelia zhihuaiae]|uniref:Abasic site processing protein n=1 Tax=Hansschlegelia zhihuaiae TaxID=405005 RepID=A0A4V1KJJ6_9HYPH|nr:SOS response-associated peptidase [Hansschlegelia zhihuaiae]RXF74422.1 SOS response-associated peptidase [Hansschlegelia zhihuaiae]